MALIQSKIRRTLWIGSFIYNIPWNYGSRSVTSAHTPITSYQFWWFKIHRQRILHTHQEYLSHGARSEDNGQQWRLCTGTQGEETIVIGRKIVVRSRAALRFTPGFRSEFDRNSQILRGIWGTRHRFCKGVTEVQKLPTRKGNVRTLGSTIPGYVL